MFLEVPKLMRSIRFSTERNIPEPFFADAQHQVQQRARIPGTFFTYGGIYCELPKLMRSIRFSNEQCIPELLSLYKSKRKMFGILLFISGQEIIFAVLIALLLFGSKEIPKLARTFGKGMKEFRRATEDIKKEFESSTPELTEDFKAIKRNLTKDADEIKRNLTRDANDIAKGVKKNMDLD